MSNNGMPPPNLLVARLGVKRAKVCMAIWFGFVYVVLLTLGIVAYVTLPQMVDGNTLVSLAVTVMLLEMIGLIVLTSMVVRFVNECRVWENARRN